MTEDDSTSQPILLVDALNLFIRSFSAFPSMTTNGEQIGGAVGFLKTLKRVVSDIRPKKIYVCWESGGSMRRRGLFKDYKSNRKPEKLNRFYEDDIPETDENRSRQVAVLTKLLKHLPVCQVYVADCEGDDVISFLSKNVFKEEHKVIMSSDKDFYQLLDEKTRIYSLHKKVYLTHEDIKKEFKISAPNFALAKSCCGDTSDNIPGIKGLGFKTLAKKFPFFESDNSLSIDDIVAFSHTHAKKSSVFKHVIENESLIRLNWQLIYLGDNSLSHNQMERISFIIGTFKPLCNKMEFIRKLIAEGIQSFEIDEFFLSFLCTTYE